MTASAPKSDVYHARMEVAEDLISEILAGELHVQPRPTLMHSHAATVLTEEISPPFRRGRGGPGGWIILFEPEIHLGSPPDILIPDLAGWRRERLAELPDAPYLELAPDWVCEILSPATTKIDRTKKLGVYRREKVHNVWFVDPNLHTLEVLRMSGEFYTIIGSYVDDEVVRAEPFDAIALNLGPLWQR